MKIEGTEIEGLYIFNSLCFPDNRGSLLKPYSMSFFQDFNYPVNLEFKETWFTKSHKNVIRAMHYQVGPNACEKLVSVIQGSILDVVFDFRTESQSYSKIFSIVLNSLEPKSLYIPKGCAHGYKVLDNDTITLYMATETHDASSDIGVLWSSIGFNWDIRNPILSEKDKELPPFINNSLIKLSKNN